MSRGRDRTLAEDWDAVTAQLQKGRLPKSQPHELPLKSIALWPGLFQHRGRRGWAGEAHIRSLTAAALKSPSQTLDPVTVWWDGRAWACIDGHHRMDAYSEAKLGRDQVVPVEVFAGTIGEAMSEAARSNTKDKLAMTSADKANAAWRMVAATDLSKAQVAMASTVSESTVANMRKVLALLKAMSEVPSDFGGSQSAELRNLRWSEAMAMAKGREAPDFDQESANEKKAQEWALALKRALGMEGGKYPEILAMALEIYDSRLPDQLAEWWGEQGDDEEESEGDAAEA